MKSIVNNIPECRAYFEQLADDHPDLKQFQYGDAQHISKETRARIKYPCLWLETPNLRFQLVNNFTTYIDVALVIVHSTEKDNTNDYRNKIDICSQIMKELLHHVKDDSEKGFVRLYNPANIQLQQIATMDADNIIGFRAEFTLSATFSHISIADKRQNVCPIGTLPKFNWDNNTQGDFSNLTITNNTLPANAGFTWLWTWSINEGTEQTSTAQTPTISGSGNRIKITLKITKDNCTRYASAKFTSASNSGESVPYKQ